MSWNNIIPWWFTCKKPDWAVSMQPRLDRSDQLLENICEHGVGHPNKDWLNIADSDGKLKLGVHGCDGCCSKS
jgi:hypothetical protein